MHNIWKMMFSISAIQTTPRCIAATFRLPSGLPVTYRPLEAGDAAILGAYFLGLSEETKRRYGPHPFDQAAADRLTAAIDYHDTIRLIATICPPRDASPAAPGEQQTTEQVIAYFIFVPGVLEADQARYSGLGLPLDLHSDCTIAPSVADACQNSGLGSLLMRRTVEIARNLGRRRMVLMGGVQAVNERGIHFYQKHGFRTVGAFENPPGFLNYDMILDLENLSLESC
jgi:GNAT superfamily N-acetyltransferase